ncbi:MAG: Gmad2 immunoglobulin-like domain-containing protein [Saprospiraceae bacterium]|nr:Gmad2 immunoglobulin-like domain-containing protein [Saprospiraceae bacterium]
MKSFLLLFIITVAACTNSNQTNATSENVDTLTSDPDKLTSDSLSVEQGVNGLASKVYANDRFKEVTVEKTGEHTYLIKGKGQIFEANFNWVVEDGHMELMEGFEMTSAGAPEWGDFQFSITVEKDRQNSTLTLVIFEISAMDGSRQYELPIKLE